MIIEHKPAERHTGLFYTDNLQPEDSALDSLIVGQIISAQVSNDTAKVEEFTEMRAKLHQTAFDVQRETTIHSPLGWPNCGINRSGQFFRVFKAADLEPAERKWEERGGVICVRLHRDGARKQVRAADLLVNQFYPVGMVTDVEHLDGDPFNLALDNLRVSGVDDVKQGKRMCQGKWRRFASACRILPTGPDAVPPYTLFSNLHLLKEQEVTLGFYPARFQAILDDCYKYLWKGKCAGVGCKDKPEEPMWGLDGTHVPLGTGREQLALLDYNKLERFKPFCEKCI